MMMTQKPKWVIQFLQYFRIIIKQFQTMTQRVNPENYITFLWGDSIQLDVTICLILYIIAKKEGSCCIWSESSMFAKVPLWVTSLVGNNGLSNIYFLACLGFEQYCQKEYLDAVFKSFKTFTGNCSISYLYSYVSILATCGATCRSRDACNVCHCTAPCLECRDIARPSYHGRRGDDLSYHLFSQHLFSHLYFLLKTQICFVSSNIYIGPSLKKCLFAVPLPCIFWLGR